MNTIWAEFHYTSSLTSDDEDGWTAVELMRHGGNRTERVARVVFWDTIGQFMLEMFADEIPVTVIEELIAEAKREIRSVDLNLSDSLRGHGWIQDGYVPRSRGMRNEVAQSDEPMGIAEAIGVARARTSLLLRPRFITASRSRPRPACH